MRCAQLTQTLGAEAAARVAQLQQDDASWQSRYTDYVVQRAQIESAGLTPQDRDAQIAALRQRVHEARRSVRAASLDRGRAARGSEARGAAHGRRYAARVRSRGRCRSMVFASVSNAGPMPSCGTHA